ncbi:MAG: M14 family metallopeptidase [Bacteroidota bacterium]
MKKYLLIFLLILSACSPKLKRHKFPTKVDTTTRPISYQEKKTFSVGGVMASNDFPAARLNDFKQLNDSTFEATILPENEPINPSPWYAFRIWSEEKEKIYLKLNYPGYQHRYYPKLSKEGDYWQPLDSMDIEVADDTSSATLKLTIGKQPLWVAAQEIEDHKRVGEWVNEMAQHRAVTAGAAGSSVQGRSLYFMDMGYREKRKKPTVIIISRQHPPEVTGFLAMKAFVETIVKEGTDNGFLTKYRVLVYPMMNPDGVDLGHYRHNTGGIDMNRDWAFYHQPEVRQVVEHMVSQTGEYKNKVVLGLDFHSTYHDVYYTNDESLRSWIPGFTKDWLSRVEKELGLEDINEQPSGLGAPVSKGWFYQQFRAEGITYEIGDDTPRDFIQRKGEISARAMMEVLMSRAEEWRL